MQLVVMCSLKTTAKSDVETDWLSNLAITIQVEEIGERDRESRYDTANWFRGGRWRDGLLLGQLVALALVLRLGGAMGGCGIHRATQ